MAEISMPSGFGGGLMRYKEEYPSKIKLKPEHVILLIIAAIVGVVALNLFL